MSFNLDDADDLTSAQIKKIYKKMPRKKISTSDGYMYDPGPDPYAPKTLEEAKRRKRINMKGEKIEKAYKMLKPYKRNIRETLGISKYKPRNMSQEEYELRLKNLKKRRELKAKKK